MPATSPAGGASTGAGGATGGTGGGDLLTRDQIEAFVTTHLEEAATHWTSTATAWEEHFSTIHAGMSRPGGTVWQGPAADKAVDGAWDDLVKVRGCAECLRSAAGHASIGAGAIAWTKRLVITKIEEAEEAGFTVTQELSVTEKFASPLMRVSAARLQQAQAFAAEIAELARNLVAADKEAARKIGKALAPLGEVSFPEHTTNDGSHVQLVDNKTTAAGDGKDKPGEKPSGAADPSGSSLADLILPPEKSDGATAHKPGDKPTAMDLIEQARRDAANRSAGQLLTPAQLQAWKDAARRALANDPANKGVPPAELERRLNAMMADPLKPPVPGAAGPDDGPRPPRPSYSDGFRDTWNSTGDGVQKLLGQDGFENFKDSWKNLGSSAWDTARDPYGTMAKAVQDEIQALKTNPEYALGRWGADATMGAATVPLGGEGMLARGAVEGAAGHALERQVVHGAEHAAGGPVAHDVVPGAAGALAHEAVPVAPHGPADVPVGGDHGLIGHGGDASPPPVEHHTDAPPGVEHHAPSTAAPVDLDLTTEHARALGMDPATGGFRAGESETALRVERELGVDLTRAGRGDAHDWVDVSGRTYDAVGNFPSKFFDSQWPNLQDRIVDHLEKAEIVPVDVSQFTTAQRDVVRAFVQGLRNPNVVIVGG